MYLPSAMLAIIYALRAILRHWFPASLRMRKFLVFLLCMYGLILFFGCFTGYARWLAFTRDAIPAQAEIIFQGRCTDALYIQGKYRRAYKRIIESSYDEQPFTDGGDLPCIGYRFKTEDGYWVYAQEEVGAASNWPLHSYVAVKYQPDYLKNNWLEVYIPATMQSSIHYAWFFAGVLLEAVVSGYFLGIRREKGII